MDGEGFSKRWFAVAKETWEDVRNVDALLDGIEPVLSTAVLYSESTREELSGQKRPLDFRNSVLGALETMTYAGRPVESIPEFRLAETLRNFELLVLPEVEVLSPASVDTIRKWVAGGGTLIASGRCGLVAADGSQRSNFELADVLGVDLEREDRKYSYDDQGHLKKGGVQIYLESTGHALTRSLAVSTVGLSNSFLRLHPRAGAHELLRYRLPAFVEDVPNHKWFNWISPPPGESGGVAAVHNRFGKGQSVYIGVPVFQSVTNDKMYWSRRWLSELVRQLVPNPVVELRLSTLPEYVHGTFFHDRSRGFVLVQILNAIELATGGQFADIESLEIRSDPARLNVTGARRVWPNERDLEVRHIDGGIRIVVPKPGRYSAMYLKLA